MANIMDLSTEDKLEYHFFPVSSGSVQFKVRTPNDAHIALTMGPQESDPMIEIFLGGWGNTKSVIRRNRSKPEKVEIETPNILNGGEFRGFWVRWDSGIISAGREGEAIPFLSWADPEPFPIAFVGVCTGWGATGTWKIEDGAEFDTPDQLAYKFGPVLSGSLKFEYRGPHNCHVALTPAPAEVDPMYEILLGGWENTKSVIRHCRQKPDKVEVPTPGIMNPNEFRQFLIEWRSGRVMVRDGESGMVIMEWSDPAPFGVTHFGVRTGWGARGQWRITHFNNPGAQPLAPSAPVAAPLYAAPPGYPGVMPAFNAPPHVLAGPGNWVDATAGQIPPGAVVGGQDCNGEPLYVARAQHEGAVIPGKLCASHGCAFIPWGGQEHGKPEYQVLVGGPNNWVRTNGSNVPPGAFPGGQSEDGEPLFVGRVNHEGSLTTGKVQQSHGVCYISFAGQELGFPDYEVLMPFSPVILESVSRKSFHETLHWLPLVDGKLPPDAMIGGFENEHIYIARAYHNNSLCPGKYVKSAGKAFVPWGRREHCKEDFEVLCGFNAKWVKTKSNYIPQNAFIGGRTGGAEVNNEPLYIGRAMYDGRLICGKAYSRYNLCYLPYKGREIEISSYEILVIPDDEIQQALPFTTFLPNTKLPLSVCQQAVSHEP